MEKYLKSILFIQDFLYYLKQAKFFMYQKHKISEDIIADIGYESEDNILYQTSDVWEMEKRKALSKIFVNGKI